MSRSIKTGPFIEQRLLGRIEQMNKKSEKKVVKTATPSRSTTAASTSRST